MRAPAAGVVAIFPSLDAFVTLVVAVADELPVPLDDAVDVWTFGSGADVMISNEVRPPVGDASASAAVVVGGLGAAYLRTAVAVCVAEFTAADWLLDVAVDCTVLREAADAASDEVVESAPPLASSRSRPRLDNGLFAAAAGVVESWIPFFAAQSLAIACFVLATVASDEALDASGTSDVAKTTGGITGTTVGRSIDTAMASTSRSMLSSISRSAVSSASLIDACPRCAPLVAPAAVFTLPLQPHDAAAVVAESFAGGVDVTGVGDEDFAGLIVEETTFWVVVPIKRMPSNDGTVCTPPKPNFHGAQYGAALNERFHVGTVCGQVVPAAEAGSEPSRLGCGEEEAVELGGGAGGDSTTMVSALLGMASRTLMPFVDSPPANVALPTCCSLGGTVAKPLTAPVMPSSLDGCVAKCPERGC